MLVRCLVAAYPGRHFMQFGKHRAQCVMPWPTQLQHRRFTTDPSGTSNKYQAAAIGSGAEGATTALQESYRKDLTLAEAELLALSTLKQVMEEKVWQRSALLGPACTSTAQLTLRSPAGASSH